MEIRSPVDGVFICWTGIVAYLLLLGGEKINTTVTMHSMNYSERNIYCVDIVSWLAKSAEQIMDLYKCAIYL